MPADGQVRPWRTDDAELFESEEEAVCAGCGEPLEEGRRVQERPAFSLRFFHVDAADCAMA
jgi:hypothetical protein